MKHFPICIDLDLQYTYFVRKWKTILASLSIKERELAIRARSSVAVAGFEHDILCSGAAGREVDVVHVNIHIEEHKMTIPFNFRET